MDLLKQISWLVNEPVEEARKESGDLTLADWEHVVFEKTVYVHYPCIRYDSVYRAQEIAGPCTLKQLLDVLADLYQRPMGKEELDIWKREEVDDGDQEYIDEALVAANKGVKVSLCTLLGGAVFFEGIRESHGEHYLILGS